MKLVHLEANFPARFGPVCFQDGLNVVFARVQDPAARQRSAHNLGKSLLMDVIDFALAGKVEKTHPFKARHDLFAEYEFTLQVRTNDGRYVSARRPVNGRAKSSVLVRDSPVAVGEYPEPKAWTHRDLSFSGYKKLLDALFGLKDVAPYPFRKGLGYQLRGQSDYTDEFQISKFAKGRERDWRPFVAKILGFDRDVLLRGYDIEDRIAGLKKVIAELEGTEHRNKRQFDEIRGLIEIREMDIAARRRELAIFSFTGVERDVNHSLVEEVEAQLAELNTRRYTIDRDLQDIRASLQTSFDFDLELVQTVYRQAGFELPGALLHDFEEVVAFNRKISSDRNERLRSLQRALVTEREKIEGKIDALDQQRQQALAILREAESFAKYRSLTDQVFAQEANLRTLREQLARLGQASTLRTEINEQKKALLDIEAEIVEEVQGSNDFFSSVRHLFNDAVRAILGARGVLSTGLNQAKHIEFKAAILDEVVRDRETHEGEGTSYKKLLCACVDLALLQAHASGDYYRFVYHDGVFEGLDNRRKVALLDYVRRVTRENDLQYILTVIDSDLPRDERDNKLMFTAEEVISSLHDSGDDGRLFRMPRF